MMVYKNWYFSYKIILLKLLHMLLMINIFWIQLLHMQQRCLVLFTGVISVNTLIYLLIKR